MRPGWRADAARPSLMCAAALMLSLWVVPHPCSAWNPFQKADPDVAEGNRAQANGDHQRALNAYRRALLRHPASAELHMNQGLAWLQGGEHEQAAAAMRKSASLTDNRDELADAYYNLGVVHHQAGLAKLKEGDPKAAAKSFEQSAAASRRALRYEPGRQDAAFNMELAARKAAEARAQARKEAAKKNDKNSSQPDTKTPQSDKNSESDERDSAATRSDERPELDEAKKSAPHPEDKEGRSGQQEPPGQEQPGQKQPQSEPERPVEPKSQDGMDDVEGRDPAGEVNSEQSGSPERAPSGGAGRAPDAKAGIKGKGKRLDAVGEQILETLQRKEQTLERHRARIRAGRRRPPRGKDW